MGIPPAVESKRGRLTPNWSARRVSYEDWQDRVAITLALAPAVIEAHWQGHIEDMRRRMFSWRDMVPWHNPSGRLPVMVDP